MLTVVLLPKAAPVDKEELRKLRIFKNMCKHEFINSGNKDKQNDVVLNINNTNKCKKNFKICLKWQK